MATVRELQSATQVDEKPFIRLSFVTYETCKMVCTECDYASDVVYEYDTNGLLAIHQWAQDHTCVVTSKQTSEVDGVWQCPHCHGELVMYGQPGDDHAIKRHLDYCDGINDQEMPTDPTGIDCAERYDGIDC